MIMFEILEIILLSTILFFVSAIFFSIRPISQSLRGIETNIEIVIEILYERLPWGKG